MQTLRQADTGHVTDHRARLDQALHDWRDLLEALQTNVFIADLDLTIVHANSSAMRTLHTIGDEIQRTFGVPVDEILGGIIHRFHRDPERVERILHQEGGNRLPHAASFSFGEVTLETRINALTVDGEQVGYVVSWEDASKLRRSTESLRTLGDDLSTAAAAVEEVSVSINEVAASCSEASTAAATAVDRTSANAELAQRLGDSSRQINDIVGVITRVASQTNLLALNATIEAARAGEAGAGFAVVASEVKELARGTAEATGDIADQVGEIQQLVESLVGALSETTEMIDFINEQQTSIAAAVEQQGAATEQLSATVASAADAGQAAIENRGG